MSKREEEFAECARQALFTSGIIEGGKVTPFTVQQLHRFMSACRAHDDYLISELTEGKEISIWKAGEYGDYITHLALGQIANWNEMR